MGDDPKQSTNTPRGTKPLMRNLGEFFGHIIHGIRTPAKPKSQTHEVRRDTEETTRHENGQKITVRRTTIEEIEVSDEDVHPN
ncbi:MAG: hypothetical protein H6815_03835 [Phycisphaeraceae bacterium]|nr:hypothetical protein [Phycisphaerales bacterium]MCB9859560.1 hypothetical protein [Phycisphaeraceae bacterium]